MDCWFEDRLAGRSRRLSGQLARIQARQPQDLPQAWAAIEAARRAGHWVALLLDYELGEWLLPEALGAPPDGINPAPRTDLPPRLTALVFEHCDLGAPWPAGPQDARARVVSVTPRQTQTDYADRIERIRAGIAAGEFYQVNYTQPLDVRIEGDPAALYRAIAQRHPVAHGAFIRDGQRTILSFSPELFVARQGERLITRPMKGTAPRATDPQEDERLGRELLSSAKNRAENLMIVDLLRNDLGRLALTGTVKVDALFSLERYPSVWTMTSTVSAQAPKASLPEVMQALFPCGSITGAPKIAAMRRIRQLEIAPRGLYCGSIGWLAPDGDFSLNVAIRTLVLNEYGQGIYNTGGGIVHDSDPALEWQECQWKARILGQPSST
ncbi:aminodeoxychorismate synthase component I [Bordetella avium]|uniref:Para-aminobenzoate synthase component I n=1 Tax=Bordetella avium (strain 197N) TaxID=360910 RepID=Q2KVT4_BORA1|nr:aminodeoxychorismate synthase component I [Bordetella avium]AZY50177.1 aminodeoxychorismate synthase, component I [Bordetella avium]AZY53572.1 aminodeoxychorismate synthase, component I [Bordetella avium]RIQ11858.1 aminodeoxychorismate synthase component I [Bordetella avium]RIQ16334.1 aminodeoxychorismate synthase component I [Bordetella avium]RIQ33974.1 aminodeoxychorismate synthase component I [Bordetella avium]